MKTIYILNTKYNNGSTENNCVTSSYEQAKKMEEFIKEKFSLGELIYKSSTIEPVEVEDNLTSYNINGHDYIIL